MIKLCDEKIMKNILNYRWYTFILIYLFFGALIFASQIANEEYFNIFHYVNINITYLVIFVFPSFLILTNNIYKIFMTDENIIIRLKERKNLAFFQFKSIFISSLVLYLAFIVIIVIAVNLTPHKLIDPNNITYNIFATCVDAIKVFFAIITINMFNVLLLNKFASKYISSFCSFIILMTIYTTGKFISSNMIINMLIFETHINGYYLFDNIIISIMYSLFFYICLLYIILKLNSKIIIKKDIMIWRNL